MGEKESVMTQPKKKKWAIEKKKIAKKTPKKKKEDTFKFSFFFSQKLQRNHMNTSDFFHFQNPEDDLSWEIEEKQTSSFSPSSLSPLSSEPFTSSSSSPNHFLADFFTQALFPDTLDEPLPPNLSYPQNQQHAIQQDQHQLQTFTQQNQEAIPTLHQFVESHLQQKPSTLKKKKTLPKAQPLPEPTDPSQPEKKKRGRKKRAKIECQGDVSSVALPREKLLVLSSNELDQVAEKFKSERPLTPQEAEELRRQRRLIKNRESAAQSRQRKKDLMEQLQQKLDEVQQENTSLKQLVQDLQKENACLKQNQARSYEMGKNPCNMPDQPQQLSQATNTTKRTGITLLVYLLLNCIFPPEITPFALVSFQAI